MRYLFTSLLSLLILAVVCFAETGAKPSNSLQTIMSQANATYSIDKVYDLDGETVVIPTNCKVVISRKGKICNGELVGQNTSIKCAKDALGVKLSGTWQTKKIKDVWFDGYYLSDDDIISNINTLQSDNINQTIFIENKEKYNCSIQNGAVIRLSSNTNLRLNTTIQLQPNDLKNYSIISIRDKQNVFVKGGTIIGDVQNHFEPKNGSVGEWGMGLRITNSKDVTAENIRISLCWGDGVYVGGHSEKKIGNYDLASKNILLKNIVCDDNRRQGMSVTHVDGLTVKYCAFINTGRTKYTRPGAGVDIEPNVDDGQNESCRNITFIGCRFEGNAGSALCDYNSKQVDNQRTIDIVSLEKCHISGVTVICVPDIHFYSCFLEDLYVFVNSSPVNATFEKCIIQSNDTQLRPRPSKAGYNGVISLKMHNCQIVLNDVEDWIENNKWRSVDHWELDKCIITIPQSSNRSKTSLSEEAQRLIRYSTLRFK